MRPPMDTVTTGEIGGIVYKNDIWYGKKADNHYYPIGLASTTTFEQAIQNGNTLSADRNIAASTFQFSLTGTNASGTGLFYVNNTNAANATAIRGVAVGGAGGAFVSSTNDGIFGTSTSGYGGEFQSATGAGIGVLTQSAGNPAGLFTVLPASTNTVRTVLQINRATSGTAATGIGGGIDFTLPTTTGATSLSSFQVVLTDANNATVTSQFRFLVQTLGGSASQVASIDGTSGVTATGTNTGGSFSSSAGVGAGGTSTSNVGVAGSSSSSVGVSGVSNTGNGGQFASTTNVGLLATSSATVAGLFISAPSSTNTVQPVLTVYRNSSSTPSAGIGGSIDFAVGTVANGVQASNAIQTILTDANNATLTSKFVIRGRNGGAAMADYVSVLGTGQTQFNKYGIGTFTGTPVFSLQTTSTGLLIEGPKIAGGSYTSTITAGSNTGTPVFTSGFFIQTGLIVHFLVTGHIATLASGLANFTVGFPVINSGSNTTGIVHITQNSVCVPYTLSVSSGTAAGTVNFTAPLAETEFFTVEGTYSL